MHLRWRVFGFSIVAVLLLIAGAAALPWRSGVPTETVRIVRQFPHDPAAFSQGLVIVNGQLYESTGQYKQSSLRKVDLTTGQVQQIVPLSDEYFAEGITVLGNRLYQVTWKERLAIVYELPDLRPIASFRYDGQGWGLTNDGRELILSDGSSKLRFLNPETFAETRSVTVTEGIRRIDKLNELEYVNGEVWANIWYSDRIARISPKTGEILGWINAGSLWPASRRPSREHVLNGIAYDASTKRLFLTGKNWPNLFEVEVVPSN